MSQKAKPAFQFLFFPPLSFLPPCSFSLTPPNIYQPPPKHKKPHKLGEKRGSTGWYGASAQHSNGFMILYNYLHPYTSQTLHCFFTPRVGHIPQKVNTSSSSNSLLQADVFLYEDHAILYLLIILV